jgi:hypothetical protein
MNTPTAPSFDDPVVQAAMAADDAEFAREAATALPLSPLPVSTDEPVVAFPEDGSGDKVLGKVTLNVMHQGVAALREFNAGPAFSPP